MTIHQNLCGRPLDERGIEGWVASNRATLEAWQAAGLDSAIISSSLGRINDIFATLRHLDPVRITGPEPQVERQRVRPLVLATPTVDIGYNFGRPDKRRQSIDRLVCDARFGDEITQRIGRAGRVLGRLDTTQPSEAVVLVSDDAARELRPYDGRSLTRAAWAAIVHGLQSLPPKHRLTGYIRSHAITESFYPIYRIHALAPPDEPVLEELFQAIREVFAPSSARRAGSLAGFFRAYDDRKRWLRQPEPRRWSLDARNGEALAKHFADYLSWCQSTRGVEVRCSVADARAALRPILLKYKQHQRDLVAFIEAQVALTDALFNFREAWQGPEAAVFDEHHLLSSQMINRYDILHLVTNYDLYVFQDQAAFERACGPTEPAELYVSISRHRSPKLAIGFAYRSSWDRPEFEARHCRSVVAVRGLHLIACERGPNQTVVMLDARIGALVEQQHVPCLIVAEESWGLLLSKLRASPFYARELQVDFPDGRTIPYKVVIGTAAFHVLPELNGHFMMLDKKLVDDAIFI